MVANLLDYILWRGDLTFEASPFNEVDNLILAKLSYINFEGIVEGRGISLQKAVQIYFEEGRDQNKNTGDLVSDSFFEMLRHLAASERFGKLRLKQYVNLRDEEKELQFSALTIDLGNRRMYVSYSGTDDTLLGWKEDFLMSVMDQVPAQEEALAYFKRIAMRYRGCQFYIGGHSKGGNLAVFAAVNVSERLKRRILMVYNNDGPGFKEDIMHTMAYQSISQRIVTLVPQSSIIGMLLEHEENYWVVKSNQKGILQHDGFSWEVCGPAFVYLKSVTEECQIVDLTIKRFLSSLTLEQREQFTNALFEILSSSENKTITDIKGDGWKSMKAMLKTYDGLNKEAKKALVDVLTLFISEGFISILEVKTPEQWKEKLSMLNWGKHEENKNENSNRK